MDKVECQRDAPAYADLTITDTVLSELKKNAEEGCVLCLLDEWDDED